MKLKSHDEWGRRNEQWRVTAQQHRDGRPEKSRHGWPGPPFIIHYGCERHECRRGLCLSSTLRTDHAKQEHSPTQSGNEWVCQPLTSLQGRLLSHGWVEGILETGQGWDGQCGQRAVRMREVQKMTEGTGGHGEV